MLPIQLRNRMNSLNTRGTQQTPIRPGDSVRDIEPGWPNYMETGTVLSVKDGMVAWRCERTGEVHLDRMSELERI